jgi:hypothetical protein
MLLAMATRARQCGAFGTEVENIVFREKRYYDLQTRVIDFESKILLSVNLGRNEYDETLIAKELGLRGGAESGSEPVAEPEPEPVAEPEPESEHVQADDGSANALTADTLTFDV